MDLGTDPGTLAVPRFGRMTAMLVEAVIMLTAMTVAARWVIRRFSVPQNFGSTISVGLVALGILAPAELAGVVWVRGLSLHEYLGSFVTAPGFVSLLMFLLLCRDANARDASTSGTRG